MANPLKVGIRYLQESKEELEKVTWPNQKDTIRYSLIVIAVSILFGAYFGVLDLILTKGVEALVTLTQ